MTFDAGFDCCPPPTAEGHISRLDRNVSRDMPQNITYDVRGKRNLKPHDHGQIKFVCTFCRPELCCRKFKKYIYFNDGADKILLTCSVFERFPTLMVQKKIAFTFCCLLGPNLELLVSHGLQLSKQINLNVRGRYRYFAYLH